MVHRADQVDRIHLFFLSKDGPERLEIILIFILRHDFWVVSDVSLLLFHSSLLNGLVWREKTIRHTGLLIIVCIVMHFPNILLHILVSA